jgi:hypothetical protein
MPLSFWIFLLVVCIFPSFAGPCCERRCDSESADQEQGEISGNKEELCWVPLVAPSLNFPQQQHNVPLRGWRPGRAGVSADLDVGGLRMEAPGPAVGGQRS